MVEYYMSELICDVQKINSMVVAYEGYISEEYLPDDPRKAELLVGAYYSVRDQIDQMVKDVDYLDYLVRHRAFADAGDDVLMFLKKKL